MGQQPSAPSSFGTPTRPGANVHMHFPVLDAIDAFDAVEISRPEDFSEGVVAVLLDSGRIPLVAIAFEHAPSDELDRVAQYLADSATGLRFEHVLLGIVRNKPSAPLALNNPAALQWIEQTELQAWDGASKVLATAGITLVDIVVVEPNGWFAVSESRSGS